MFVNLKDNFKSRKLQFVVKLLKYQTENTSLERIHTQKSRSNIPLSLKLRRLCVSYWDVLTRPTGLAHSFASRLIERIIKIDKHHMCNSWHNSNEIKS